jgi:3D (Asp-Asp-Asp) domain-containing protein
VDPHYHRLGNWFYVEGVGYAKAYDTGSAIKGPQRADITLMSRSLARHWGVRRLRVYSVDSRFFREVKPR